MKQPIKRITQLLKQLIRPLNKQWIKQLTKHLIKKLRLITLDT